MRVFLSKKKASIASKTKRETRHPTRPLPTLCTARPSPTAQKSASASQRKASTRRRGARGPKRAHASPIDVRTTPATRSAPDASAGSARWASVALRGARSEKERKKLSPMSVRIRKWRKRRERVHARQSAAGRSVLVQSPPVQRGRRVSTVP